MRRIALSFVGLSALLACWACSSSSSDSNPRTTSDDQDAGDTSQNDASASSTDGGLSKTDAGPISTTDGGGPIAIVAAPGTVVSGTSTLKSFFVRDTNNALTTDGGPRTPSVSWCGFDASGALICDGDETGDDSATALSGVVRVVAGGDQHTCLIDSSDDLSCWGNNINGQIGNGTQGFNEVGLTKVVLPAKVKDVSASNEGVCALLSTGDIYCWGGSGYADSTTPTKISFAEAIASRGSDAQGQDNACVIGVSGSVHCAGFYGGTNSIVDIAHLAGAQSLSTGTDEVCGVFADGSVKCVDISTMTTADPSFPEKISEVSLGSHNLVAHAPAVARAASGNVYRWQEGFAPTKMNLP